MSSPANIRSAGGEGSQSDSPGGATAAHRKEKKRVGFHRGEGDRPTSLVIDDAASPASPEQQTQPLQPLQPPPLLVVSPRQPDGGDAEESYPFATPSATPKRDLPTPTGAPDAAELRRALSQVLTSPEGTALGAHSPSSGSATPEGGSHQQLRRPRPVLKRNTSFDAPEERERADIAELNTGERAHRSGLAARQRAHNLAARVETYASPHTSRRVSNDHTMIRPSVDSDEGHDLEAGNRGKSTGVSTHRGRDRTAGVGGSGAGNTVRSRPRKDSRLTAESLVRTHTRRVKHGVSLPDYFTYEPPPGTRSGAVTPTAEQEYAHDYVPPPSKYHGGILGSLLKLYNDGGQSGGSSGRTTPAVTPTASPPSSVPPSAAPSTQASPAPSRPTSGILGGGTRSASNRVGLGLSLRHQDHASSASQRSPALSELMKSTSTLMAPASSAYSEGVKHKFENEARANNKKRPLSGLFGETPPSGHRNRHHKKSASEDGKAAARAKKSKQDQVRITIHIAQILSRHKYLVRLCRALMMYGAPTHRLEEYMTMSARVLEIEGQFLYLPGSMIISFDDSATHTTEVKIVRAGEGLNLGKLHDVHHVYKQVIHDHISADEATAALDAIMREPLRYSRWLRVLVYGAASASVAPFAFEGHFVDMPVAFALGCLLGWMQLIVAPSNELYANVFEVTAAILTSFLSRAFGSIRDPRSSDPDAKLFCFSALAQSSIALILPGYMFLCSALELQSRHIIAGSVRMVYALIYTLFLGYGMTIGIAIYGMMDREGASSDTHCANPLHRNWNLLMVPSFTLSLCLVNHAKWRQTPVMVFIALAGHLVNSYSSTYFRGATQVSSVLGALAVGLLANTYSRAGRHVENAFWAALDWWDERVRPRFSSASRRRNEHHRRRRAPRRRVDSSDMYDHHPLQDMSGGEGPSSSVPATPSSRAFATDSAVDDDNDDPNSEKPTDSAPASASAPAPAPGRRARQATGYGLAAAVMLPAIFVQVPGGLASGGSLIAGVTTANQITNTTVNGTSAAAAAAAAAAATAGSAPGDGIGNSQAFVVLFSVIQVAVGITVGLFLSAVIVYPLGKRRSGLLSF